jgi:hypothetical protein
VRYIGTLAAGGLLRFPVVVSRNADTVVTASDFVVYQAGHEPLGVEHTTAGTEKSQQARTELDRSPEGTRLVGERALLRPGESPQTLEAPCSFTDWIAWMRAAAEAKLAMPTNSNALKLATYELLIDDNGHWHTLFGYSDGRLNELRDALQDLWLPSPAPYSRVSILCSGALLLDVAGQAQVLPTPDWWRTDSSEVVE